MIQFAKKLNPEIKFYQMILDSNSFNLIATEERNR